MNAEDELFKPLTPEKISNLPSNPIHRPITFRQLLVAHIAGGMASQHYGLLHHDSDTESRSRRRFTNACILISDAIIAAMDQPK